MPTTRRISVQATDDATLDQGIAAIQQELELPQEFPPEVEAAAANAAANPRLPDLDRTDVALVTIDPPGSMDLDQAMCLERNANGYRVYYAIADVAAFVTAGDPVDVEANRRGETLYGANSRIPLHPTVLSEGAASLLPGQLRPALLWMIDLDKSGEIAAIDVHRARVKSRARLDYAGVQKGINGGTADPIWGVLQEIGELRQQLEHARGGLTLNLPEQEIACTDGRWEISYRVNQPVEDWNAQISLLTGIAAARLMVDAKVGLLRTMPDPDPQAVRRLELTAKALGLTWPNGQSYQDFIRTLDPTIDRHVAMLTACTSMLRGAGYTAFNGSLPAQPKQSAIAAEYAHATAPLRRLGDRYVGEVCVALCAKQPVPDWTLAALPGVPDIMQVADRRAHQYERAVIELIEAAILAPRVGESFAGTIIEVANTGRHGSTGGVVMLRDPAIEARVSSRSTLTLGADVHVQLTAADPATHSVQFECVDDSVG
jgi:exoribonuclease R